MCRFQSMILEQSSSGIPFTLLSSSRATSFTTSMEFCGGGKKKKKKKKGDKENLSKVVQILSFDDRIVVYSYFCWLNVSLDLPM